MFLQGTAPLAGFFKSFAPFTQARLQGRIQPNHGLMPSVAAKTARSCAGAGISTAPRLHRFNSGDKWLTGPRRDKEVCYHFDTARRVGNRRHDSRIVRLVRLAARGAAERDYAVLLAEMTASDTNTTKGD